MPYRNKTYEAFDGDNDIHCYYLMKAWKQNDNTNFDFYDAHDINTAQDTSTEETIKCRLRERMANSKVFVLLVGEHTKNLYKFVRWEIEEAIRRDLPIIVVNLNGCGRLDEQNCPPILRDKLAVHINFSPKIMQYALENWPSEYYRLKSSGTVGSRYYGDHIYAKLR